MTVANRRQPFRPSSVGTKPDPTRTPIATPCYEFREVIRSRVRSSMGLHRFTEIDWLLNDIARCRALRSHASM